MKREREIWPYGQVSVDTLECSHIHLSCVQKRVLGRRFKDLIAICARFLAVRSFINIKNVRPQHSANHKCGFPQTAPTP